MSEIFDDSTVDENYICLKGKRIPIYAYQAEYIYEILANEMYDAPHKDLRDLLDFAVDHFRDCLTDE